MLVKLYEQHKLITWVKDNFSRGWASELDTALSNQPTSCFIALHKTTLIGFACYDASALVFFGLPGVIHSSRNKGIGGALTIAESSLGIYSSNICFNPE